MLANGWNSGDSYSNNQVSVSMTSKQLWKPNSRSHVQNYSMNLERGSWIEGFKAAYFHCCSRSTCLCLVNCSIPGGQFRPWKLVPHRFNGKCPTTESLPSSRGSWFCWPRCFMPLVSHLAIPSAHFGWGHPISSQGVTHSNSLPPSRNSTSCPACRPSREREQLIVASCWSIIVDNTSNMQTW